MVNHADPCSVAMKPVLYLTFNLVRVLQIIKMARNIIRTYIIGIICQQLLLVKTVPWTA